MPRPATPTAPSSSPRSRRSLSTNGLNVVLRFECNWSRSTGSLITVRTATECGASPAASLPPAPSVSPNGGIAFRTTTDCALRISNHQNSPTQVQVQVQVQQVCARPSSAARWPRLRPRAACPTAWRPPSTHLPARGRSGATRAPSDQTALLLSYNSIFIQYSGPASKS